MDNSAAVEQADHAGASKKSEHYKRWEYYTSESASSTARSRRTSFVRATKLPTATPSFSTRPRSSSCASI
eukprot:581899-Pleurochrysis_carterae.AAC.1